MPRSRTSWAESRDAVRETRSPGGAGAGASGAGAARLPGGEAVAGGVLSASARPAGLGRRWGHRVERRRGPPQSLGVLEVFLSPPARGASLEPSTRASRVLRAPPELAAADEAPRACAPPAAALRPGSPERDVGPRFHGRSALRRPGLPRTHHHRRG